jgi:hypothetical protein
MGMAQCLETAKGRYGEAARCALAPNHEGSHVPSTAPNAKDTQVGGAHYINESGIQPWDVIAAWNLDYWEGNVVKYVMRYRNKNGVEDLKKARHYLDYLIQREEEYGVLGDGRS